jgi:hypothetical protein
MSSKSRRRDKAKAPQDGFSAPEPTKKRVRINESGENTYSPLMGLPIELQLIILDFLDIRSVEAMSSTCTHFDEISKRLLWSMQPVDAIEKNFETLDEFEELKSAVRYVVFCS